MPEASSLALIRRDIDQKPHKLKRILRAEGLRREFFNGISDNEEEVVKAFVSGSNKNALKTKPKWSIATGNWLILTFSSYRDVGYLVD
ncbi:hypothetical protein FGG08_002473 [Glutinoglossum americanum]|uniref:Uncharacterized protein n=1 Tax=Glutinoglossum americanum TaxID=1670608 RepID=A0A9P8L1N4_9PEZI|nr:hypothetical protein FGG08_002473 [Glutinoglossum americanum]